MAFFFRSEVRNATERCSCRKRVSALALFTFAGELATVESLVSGVIPAAVVRTDAGRTRRVRAVDLHETS